MVQQWSIDRLQDEMEADGLGDAFHDKARRWLDRGDGVAVYENHDMGHPHLGDRRLASYGSEDALLGDVVPPDRLPDMMGQINWRYLLVAVVTPHERRLERAQELEQDELERHASVSLNNRHECRDCFTCACVEVMIDRLVEPPDSEEVS